MEIVRSIADMQTQAERLRREGKSIGIVPTMGFLHDGHLSLIARARKETNIVVTTLFVNPAQFGPNEDLEQYPRDRVRDEKLAAEAGTDILFMPEARDMYPEGYRTYVVTEELAGILEGKIRPTHFRGVTTVVMKLFQIVKPHIAVFGQKDAQQAAIIRQMIRDLNLDVRLIVAPIVREADGLAMSSRNVYLNPDERKSAVALWKSLRFAEEAIGSGERSLAVVRSGMEAMLQEARASSIDYIAFVHPNTFREIDQIEPPEVLIALAVRFGRTRLLDNAIVSVPAEATS
jgi:pantoate--beta-alanine ligase